MTLSNLSSSSLYRVGTGLVGVGNWAYVTATTGSPTKAAYTDGSGTAWTYYQWASSGSVTTTAGLVDALIVGGGGGAGPSGTSSGGRVQAGIQSLGGSTHTVTVGAGGTAANYASGRWSGIGSIFVGDIKGLNGSSAGETGGGDGAANGIPSSITNTLLYYGSKVAGTPAANTGATSTSTSTAGGSGVVIIRVPSTFALA